MIAPREFLAALEGAGIRFFTGVPDSLLKEVCGCFTAHLPPGSHVIATNEGSAVGLAIGHFLATGHPALVYMQNSGLGNAANPLASLADRDVYGIPMLLLIGWRGEILPDGRQACDEPQHRQQGRITPGQLDLLGIPHRIMTGGLASPATLVQELTDLAIATSGPVAMLVRKGIFSAEPGNEAPTNGELPSRESAIGAVLAAVPENVPIVSTTPTASRGWRNRRNGGPGR